MELFSLDCLSYHATIGNYSEFLVTKLNMKMVSFKLYLESLQTIERYTELERKYNNGSITSKELQEAFNILGKEIELPSKEQVKGAVKKGKNYLWDKKQQFELFKRKYEQKFYNHLDTYKKNTHIKDVNKSFQQLKRVIKELEYTVHPSYDGSYANRKTKTIGMDSLANVKYDPNFSQKKYLKMMIVLAHEVGHAIQHHDPEYAQELSDFEKEWFQYMTGTHFDKDNYSWSKSFVTELMDEYRESARIWIELDAWDIAERFIPPSLKPYFMRSAAHYLTGYLYSLERYLPDMLTMFPEVRRRIKKFVPNYEI
jgi:hypothetical protein